MHRRLFETALTIRRLANADAETISQAFAGHEQQIIVLVAECDTTFAGYLKIVWNPEYFSFPEIQDLNVLPKCRRRGIASALMDKAEAIVARRSSRVGIGVGLHPGYNAARRMYALRGYVPDGRGVTWRGAYIRERQNVVADDDLVLHLIKELPNGS